MTEAMPFLRKLILLSYAPPPCGGGLFSFRRMLDGVPFQPAL